jgi:ABC-2 type transport system ATP-binding protein
MGQRLGIATALLGDPQTYILDEPVNGLDPEGIRWIRDLLHKLASDGRTVFVSSHLMSEMALTAQHLIVVGRGRLIADTSVEEFIASASRNLVRVRTSDVEGMRALLSGPDVTIAETDGALQIAGLTTDQIGVMAARAGLTLLELSAQQASLEEAFMDVTADSVEFHAAPTTALPAREGGRA